MNNVLEYKGYHTRIEFDSEDMILHGKIEGINDLVNFESDSIENIELEFHNAVDDYLIFCEQVGKSPDKEYSGSFNVRLGPDLHRAMANKASKENVTLNNAMIKAAEAYCYRRYSPQILNINVNVENRNSSRDMSSFSRGNIYSGTNYKHNWSH